MNKIKISLNHECPCRSGKKYKKCCMGRISEEQEEYFSFLQYFDKIKDKLIEWFWLELEDSEREYYARTFGVKNTETIKKQKNPAEFFEWLFYQAKDKETNENILKVIIEKYPYIFNPDELLMLRERLKSYQAGVFEILSSDEKSWKIKLKEINTEKTYEVMDRLGSLDSAIGDILLTRIEKIFSKYYLCGFGLRIPRRSSDKLISHIKRNYELKKKENPSLSYEEFMNSNLREIMKFSLNPTIFLSSDGEELKFCEGKFKAMDEKEDIDLLMNYFFKNKDFEIIEADYKKRTAHIILKKQQKEIDKKENAQIISSFAMTPDGERIEYSGSIDIKGSKIKIFSQSEKIYRNIINQINSVISEKLILISEKIESAEDALKNYEKKDNSKPRRKEDIDPDNALAKKFLTDYYKKWCDEKIPALNNKTPREAIKNEEGRRLLKELLLEIKNLDEHKRKTGEINFSSEKIIRDELQFYN